MKKGYLLTLIVLCFAALQLFSQKPAEHAQTTRVTAAKNSLTCKINNKQWTSASIRGIKSKDIGKLTLSAGGLDKSGILLNMPVDIKPGTYTIGKMGSKYTANYNKSDKSIFHAISGTLTITSVTEKSIEGTFSFIASSRGEPAIDVQITNGSFSTDIGVGY